MEQFVTSKVSSTAWLRGHARKGPAGSNLRHAGVRERVQHTEQPSLETIYEGSRIVPSAGVLVNPTYTSKLPEIQSTFKSIKIYHCWKSLNFRLITAETLKMSEN